MSEKDSRDQDAKRTARYEQVLSAAVGQDEFTLDELHQACSEEAPAFVTRVVKTLEREGVVQRIQEKPQPIFRWLSDRRTFSPSHWIGRTLFRAQIPRTPKLERPRERLLALGAAALRTAELLAILVRSGLAGESALQAGERIAAHYTNRLEKLVHAGRGELKEISRSVGETAYCQIMAGIELGRRVEEARSKSDTPDTIRGSEDARDFCATRFARLAIDGAQEEFHIVTLDTKNHVIDTHQVSRGVLDQAIVQPREVFRPAIKDSAKAIILVHNHPSGDPRPSDQDRTLTTRLEEAGRVLGIQVLDHIIVGRLGTLSMQEYQEG